MFTLHEEEGDTHTSDKIPTLNSGVVIEVALRSFCPLLVHLLTARGVSEWKMPRQEVLGVILCGHLQDKSWCAEVMISKASFTVRLLEKISFGCFLKSQYLVTHDCIIIKR